MRYLLIIIIIVLLYIIIWRPDFMVLSAEPRIIEKPAIVFKQEIKPYQPIVVGKPTTRIAGTNLVQPSSTKEVWQNTGRTQ